MEYRPNTRNAVLNNLRDYKKFDKDVIFEDSEYVVSKTCAGEWGGSIWFKNKKSGKVFSCSATCVKSVNKLNGKYFVSISLLHGYGSSAVLEIEDPIKMEVFNKPNPNQNITKPSYDAGDLESKSRKGVKILSNLDHGELIIFSFNFNEVLCYLVKKEDGIFLSVLEIYHLLSSLNNTKLH